MNRQFGRSWVLLTLAFALHVADEAVNDFLSVYNPRAQALRQQIPWLPIPTFTFPEWLGGLVVAVIVLLALSPPAYRDAAAMRILAWPYSLIMLLNGLGHIGGSLYMARFMPGVYSAPLLLAAAVYLLLSV